MSAMAREVILVAAIAAKVPPSTKTLQGVILAVTSRIRKPAVELVEGQAVIIIPLSEIELRVRLRIDVRQVC